MDDSNETGHSIGLSLSYEAWKLAAGSSRGRIMWRVAFVSSIWVIWRQRNLGCFEGKCYMEILIDKVRYFAASLISQLP